MWSPTVSPDELYHHGIKGMHWGVRHYQNPDGSLTPAGYKHYGYGKNEGNSKDEEPKKKKFSLSEDQKSKLKKVAIGTAVVGGVALGAYAAYKLNSPQYIAKVNMARTGQTVEEYLKNASDREVRDLVKNTPKENFKLMAGRIQRSDNGGLSKLEKDVVNNRSELHEAASKELTKRMNNIDDTLGDRVDVKKGVYGSKIFTDRADSQSRQKIMNAQAVRDVKDRQAAAARAAREAAAKASLTEANVASNTASKVTNIAQKQGGVTKITKGGTAKVTKPVDSQKLASQLSSNGKTKSTPTKDFNLVFGSTTSSNSSSKSSSGSSNRATDLERLLANSRSLQMMASQSYSQATKKTGQREYSEELLKKNKGKLSNMTMQDLKDLDLY